MSQYTRLLNLVSSQSEVETAGRAYLYEAIFVRRGTQKAVCVLDRAMELLHNAVMNSNRSGLSEIKMKETVHGPDKCAQSLSLLLQSSPLLLPTSTSSLHFQKISVQTSSRAHQASYPKRTGGRGEKLTTHLHIMQGSRMVELIPHSPTRLHDVLLN